MKLEFTLAAAKLNAVLKAVLAVNTDCVLAVSDSGITIRMIDPSNAAMIAVDMAPPSFDTFDAEEGDIAVDTREILEKTTTFDPATVLTVSFDNHNKKIIVTGEGARYGIATMPISAVRKVPNIPNLDLPVEVEVDAAQFRKMVKRAGLVSDHIMIGYSTADEFFVSAEGDTNNFKQDTLQNPCKIIYKSELETLYSLDMIEPMVKIATGLMNIRLGRDLPMIMVFDLEGVEITFLLAPRIEKTAEDA